MRYLNIECPPRNRVTAVFGANAFSFELPLAATLEDLAARLSDLRKRDDGTLIGVNVRLRETQNIGRRS